MGCVGRYTSDSAVEVETETGEVGDDTVAATEAVIVAAEVMVEEAIGYGVYIV